VLIRLDPASDAPLYEQIAGQLRRALAEGTVSAGERLPTARDLASGLGVNMHTVLRAYQTLRDEQLVEMRRSRGVVVTAEATERVQLSELARSLVHEARRAGLHDAEIRTLLEAQL